MGLANLETKLYGGNSKDDLADALKSKESFKDRKNIHKIVSFSIIFLDTNGKMIFGKKLWTKCRRIFFQTLDNVEEDILLSICKNKASLDIKSLSSGEVQRFNSATHFEICHIKFDNNDRLKCKNLNHCHYSNKFRCASCTIL